MVRFIWKSKQKEKTIQEIIHTTDSQRVRKILFVQSLRLMCVL